MPNKIQADFSTHIPEINNGISEKDRRSVAKGLTRFLAETYFLYLKTQNYHWNVRGPSFRSLHKLFEEQYKELSAPIDEIAERIRALGEFVPASFASFSKLSTIREEATLPSAEEMLHQLIIANETVVMTARETIHLTDECEDDVTADLLVDRMKEHEKNAWMLRSMLPSKHTH
jgi:starvation-inducible DNA-binding protein